ncbi:MAG: hypothetical protein HQK55_11245 [Deltaproteobacteria bacterium]|nr:hypothetical protein [Deltaproteobacteria bacterium]
MKRLFVFIGAGVVIMIVSVFLLTGSYAEQLSPKALFEQKCSLCHQPDRALGKSKTPDGWKETVTRMQKNSAGKITAEEAAVIMQYLSETRPAK